MIIFSSFNNTNLLPSMVVDCCMLKSREWGFMAAVGRRRPPWSREIASSRKPRLLALFLRVCHHHRHASYLAHWKDPFAEYCLGVARPFLMLKALFLILPWKKPSKHWCFNQIDGTNQFGAKIYIRLILGILFLGHYSSAKMLYATRSLLNALILFFYGILWCRRYIQKLTKWSQKHNFHRNHITIYIYILCSAQ